ncbi:MAG: TIM barrel protein [Chloroflexota bacterium]
MAIEVANAPVSWGALGVAGEVYHYTGDQVLDEIARAGYAGTELGPIGFLGTNPAALRLALAQRGLTLTSAFFWADLADAGHRSRTLDDVRHTASLLGEVGGRWLVLSDYFSPRRLAIAGRVAPDGGDSWTADQWRAVADTVQAVIEICRPHGVRVAFHNHAGTSVERPEELDRLLELGHPDELGLCLDTGHYAYAGGDPAQAVRRYGARVWHVHLKDISGAIARQASAERIGFMDAVGRGLFVPIGQGVVRFAEVIAALRAIDYAGWVVVEQDVVADQTGQLTPDPLVSALASRAYLRERFGL